MHLKHLSLFLLIQCVSVVWACSNFTQAADPKQDSTPDSYKYYGPGGLSQLWDKANWQSHRIGRDTWIFWTWGNQKFLRLGSTSLGNQPLPISIDLFRALDSRQRNTRFARLGLINEPNCRPADKPDEFGLWLDVFEGDPLHYYPGDPQYDEKQHYPGTNEKVDTKNYGKPSGVLGLRLFDNPKFKKSSWDVKKYFDNPAAVEPPYLVGFTCALCHIAFDPLNPPIDREHPRWDNLAANMGNQYLREGELFLNGGRVIMGNLTPGPKHDTDPYDTKGVEADSFLYHYAVTQQPGTSETSRLSYDFINNPNTMNAIFNLGHRREFEEVNPEGKKIKTMHILKDGADSVGVEWALMRVPINIGCEGPYWADSLFNPFTNDVQHPFRIAEALWKLPDSEKQKITERFGVSFSDVLPERIESLKRRYKEVDAYGQEFGSDFAEAWKRHGALADYLVSYKPFHLMDAPEGVSFITSDAARLEKGRTIFADTCARCHSNIQPDEPLSGDRLKEFHRQAVARPDFLKDNTLTDDVRYSVAELGTNMARAIATNAIEDDIWAEFSSRDYKQLPNISKNPLQLKVPVFLDQDPVTVSFRPPAGGRGYYRTPSLVSIWATAPFLHNNSLGNYSDDPSVKGRVKSFEDGITKMLWPEKREMVVKRTSKDCTLLPQVTQLIPKILSQRITEEIRWQLREKFPAALIDTLVREVQPKLEAHLTSQITKLENLNPDQLIEILPDLIVTDIMQKGRELDLPDEFLRIIKLQSIERLQADLKTLHALVKGNLFIIPKGTPVNLYANINLASLPAVVVAHLKYPKGSRPLAEELLRLSACPDLVEDRGHLYGSDLKDQEKLDLIEYLKTL